jgi:hypothetical protein
MSLDQRDSDKLKIRLPAKDVPPAPLEFSGALILIQKCGETGLLTCFAA